MSIAEIVKTVLSGIAAIGAAILAFIKGRKVNNERKPDIVYYEPTRIEYAQKGNSERVYQQPQNGCYVNNACGIPNMYTYQEPAPEYYLDPEAAATGQITPNTSRRFKDHLFYQEQARRQANAFMMNQMVQQQMAMNQMNPGIGMMNPNMNVNMNMNPNMNYTGFYDPTSRRNITWVQNPNPNIVNPPPNGVNGPYTVGNGMIDPNQPYTPSYGYGYEEPCVPMNHPSYQHQHQEQVGGYHDPNSGIVCMYEIPKRYQ